MCWVGGVLHDAGGRLPVSGKVEITDGGEADSDSSLCSLHQPLQGFLLCNRAASVSHTDSGAQNTLHHASAENLYDWISNTIVVVT